MNHYRPYVSIDIETTGLDEDTCQVLEIGAVIDDWHTPFTLLPKFRCYVDHGTIVGEPYALSMHPKILRAIATGTPQPGPPQIETQLGGWREGKVTIYRPETVTSAFLQWLYHHRLHLGNEKIIIAGKNFGSFDLQFLKRLPKFGEYVRIKHRIIDPGNLYFNPATDDGPPDMSTCMKRAGIQGEVAHTALADAMTVVKLVRHWERDRG